tara:strand:+ start:12770 stop:13732 length:963 start_codon:yes stop_codon:yes gene_type:complete
MFRTARQIPQQTVTYRESGGGWPRVVWCIHDTRAGHRQQLQGLAQALQIQQNAAVYWLPYTASPRGLPPPELILVCGRRTHWAGLRARWRHGGKLVALMNPGLLRRLFDACIVPEHDGLRVSPRTIVTRGPLNPLQPAGQGDPQRGLILVGGPSRHFHWDSEGVLQQIQRLRTALPGVEWLLTTSRRTPEDFVHALRTVADQHCRVLTAAETAPRGLAAHYRERGIAWVTADSAAMLYEALSSGAAVGVLNLQPCGANRLQAGLEKLIAQGDVAELETVERTGAMPAARPPLHEAQRAAAALRARQIAWSHEGHCSRPDK